MASEFFINDAGVLLIAGLVSGALLGAASRVARFCALGAIEDAVFGVGLDRVRMWATAGATAVVGAHVAAYAGLVDFGGTPHLAVVWNPLASIVGGLLFGYGMALVGTCAFGALARLGGGDFRGLVVALVVGMSAHIVLSGPLAGVRLALFQQTTLAPGATEPSLSFALGAPRELVAAVLAGSLLAWAFASPAFRASRQMWMWSICVGLAITLGWVSTGWVATQGFAVQSATSLGFVEPIGDTVIAAMTSTGASGPSFSVSAVLGVVLGAAIGSALRGDFRWEACDDAPELRRQIVGAALMGVGGVLTVGCTIGQGLTAFSSLALSAPIVVSAIALGAWLGLRQLVGGLVRA